MAEETDVAAEPSASSPPRLTSELISNAVGELEARNITLERELEGLRQTATEREEQVSSLERLVARAESRVQELESATSEAAAQAAADATQALADSQRELETERASGAEQAKRLQQAEALMTTTMQEADSTRSRLSDLEADLADRDDRIRRTEGVIAELTEANATLRAELDEARQAAMDAVETIMSLEGAAEEGQRASESVETRVAEVARERDQGAEKLTTLEAEVEDLRGKLAAAETLAVTAAAQADEAGRGAGDLQREVHESRVRVEQISQAAEAALDAARRRLADADRELQVGLQAMQRDDDLSVPDLLRLLAVHDVLLVVDGDHLATEAYPELSTEAARARVCEALAGDRGPHSATVRIVFDADRPETVPSSAHGGTIITAVRQASVAGALRDAVEHTPLGHDLYLVGAAEPVDSLRLVTSVDVGLAVALVHSLTERAVDAPLETTPDAPEEIDLTSSDASDPEPAEPDHTIEPEATTDEPALATATVGSAESSLAAPPPAPAASATPTAAAKRKPRWGEPPEPVAVVARPPRPTIIEGSPVHAERPDAPQRPWWRRRG